MERVVTYNLGENFIENLSRFILENFANTNDFSRIALCFGGHRPNLFLRRKLSNLMHEPYYPPKIFSIDEFVEYIVSPEAPVAKISELDSCYLVYLIAKKVSKQILPGRENFSQFLPWAKEIVSFIEQLDLEAIGSSSLGFIQQSASIGYDVPQNLNVLLEHLVKIREEYHLKLAAQNQYCRGLLYLKASKEAGKNNFSQFDAIIFCNFFYMHKTELAIVKSIYENKKGIYIFQGAADQWPVLKNNALNLGIEIKPKNKSKYEPNFELRTGFDLHSQVCLVRETLKEIKEPDKTVIVTPRPEALLPLLFEVSGLIKDFNVSLGYPFKRSSIFALLKALFKAQESKKSGMYYARDYLDALRHPLVKNIKFSTDTAITRVVVHKIEEVLIGKIKSDLGGCLFVSLEDIERLNDIYSAARNTLRNLDISIAIDELKQLVKELHQLFFNCWSLAGNFLDFSSALCAILDTLIKRSAVTTFAFNLKVMDKILSSAEALKTLSFSKEFFSLDEMCEIFLRSLESEMISFIGSPLKGLQILGLFETRSLAFDNVIIMDANESILPKLKIYEPLLPREVMLALGLNRLEKEEEIQRYQFVSLISAAKNAYIIYEENQEKEKSRFIEELLWKKQLKLNKLKVAEIPKAVFNLKLNRKEISVRKTSGMIETLKTDTYSASRLNVYLECPLEFYYKYVLGLSENEDLLDEPQAPDVGNFIHGLLEDTFKKFIGKSPLINKEFKDYFWQVFTDEFSLTIEKRMKSDSLLLKGIIKNRLKNFLEEQANSQINKILYLEEELRGRLELAGLSLNFVTKVDRVDELKDNSLSIIDYKTGKIDRVPKKLEHLKLMDFDRKAIKENIKSFQLPLYYYFVQQKFPDKNINASLYSIRTLERKPFICDSDYNNRGEVLRICLKALEAIFSEIFNPEIPFAADKDENRCQNCEFRRMCV